MTYTTVYGPPGCGKTTHLARQVKRATAAHGPVAVVVGSLTRTAAQEVAGRDTGLPKENVGTLHAHAYRALGRPSIMETTESLKAWNEWVPSRSFQVSNRHAANPEHALKDQAVFEASGDEALNLMGLLRARMVSPDRWPAFVQRFAEKWEEFKVETGRLDFTDLIERCLLTVDQLPQKPAVFMLDEAQDLSRLEAELAKKWGAACGHFVSVLDSDQALYTWRGADPYAFDAADNEIVLGQSYRVPAAVVEWALGWIAQIADRKPITYVPRDAPGSVVRTNLCLEETRTLAERLEALRTAGRRVMVLATCGYMLAPLCAELKKRAIPFHNPYRPDFNAWNPLNGARQLLAYLRPDGATWGDEARMWSWHDLALWTDPMQASGYLERGTKDLLKSKTQKDKLGSDPGADIARLDQVLKLIPEKHWEPAFDMNIDWWEESLRHTQRQRHRFTAEVARRHGGGALRTEVRASAEPDGDGWPGIILGTVHSVKGGQADDVFLFPDLSNAGYWNGWRKGGESKDSVVRTMYVGATRARENLYLCGPISEMAVKWN